MLVTIWLIDSHSFQKAELQQRLSKDTIPQKHYSLFSPYINNTQHLSLTKRSSSKEAKQWSIESQFLFFSLSLGTRCIDFTQS